MTAISYLKEDALDVTPESPTSGSVLISSQWLVGLTKEQILNLPNANSFLNGLIGAINNMKNEFDASGSVATGSISRLQ